MRGMFLAIAAFLAMGAFRTAPTAQAASERPLIIVGESYPPYEYEENSQPTGINVDVIKQVMTRLGVTCEFRFMPFTRVQMNMQKGAADAALSVSHQPDRESYMLFTPEQKAFLQTGVIPPDYLWITDYVFFVNRRKSEIVRFDSLEAISAKNFNIGVIKYYSYSKEFREAPLRRRTYVQQAEALQALVSGEIDLVPMDRTVGQWLLRDLGLGGQLTFLPKSIFTKPYLLAFSAESDYPDLPNLMLRFYAELRKMRANGEYDEIRNRYLGVAPGAERPLVFVCEDWMPFEYMKDGEVRGIDAEVTRRIMGRLGIPYVISIYPWKRAWTMAEKGDADAVLSVSYSRSREPVLYYTEEQRRFPETGTIPPDYLWISDYVFFVKRKNAGSIRFESYEQIRKAGLKVGTNPEYTYCPEFLAASLSTASYPDVNKALMALVEGEIDLYPIDRTVGLARLKEMGLSESVTYLPKVLFSKPYLAPFVRGSKYPGLEDIMKRYYAELRQMRSSGEYDEIVRSYGGEIRPVSFP